MLSLTTTFIIVLIIAALAIVLLAWLEVFFIPGLGWGGTLATIGLVSVMWYLARYYGWGYSLAFSAGCMVLFGIGFYFLSRTKWVDKVALQRTLPEKAQHAPTHLQVGTPCVALSRLALTGQVEANGIRFEACSDSGFIPEGTPLVVSRITANKIYVKAANSPQQEHYNN